MLSYHSNWKVTKTLSQAYFQETISSGMLWIDIFLIIGKWDYPTCSTTDECSYIQPWKVNYDISRQNMSDNYGAKLTDTNSER